MTAQPGFPFELTQDRFLGGRVKVAQPARGFRSGTDAVLLAAAVPAHPGETVLELGVGAGVVALCLGWRVPGLGLAGVEIDPAMARLARHNAALNGLALEVFEADVGALPAELRRRSFDHVVMNPPYYEPRRGTRPEDPRRALGNAGPRPLADWMETALRRLRPGGRLTVIQRTPRLPEILAQLSPRLGDLRVVPIQGRAGRPAGRFLLSGRKGSGAPFRLLPPLVMHRTDTHVQGSDDLSPTAARVLREGGALDFFNG